MPIQTLVVTHVHVHAHVLPVSLNFVIKLWGNKFKCMHHFINYNIT